MATDVATRTEVQSRRVEETPIGVEDVWPVRSRVGWGAIFAGAVVALASYLILTLLGGATGLTVGNQVASETIATGAAIWAIIATVAALFLGGWVTSQCIARENKSEAVIHGVIMWGVVLFMILWLVSSGMRAGFSAMWGVATFTTAAAENTRVEDWEAAAQRSGVSQDQIAQWKQSAQQAPQNVAEAVRDPQNQEAAMEYATQASWYTLLGTVLSMAAAVGGSLLGAGPTFRLMPVPIRVRRAY
jgi:hypothetical protein